MHNGIVVLYMLGLKQASKPVELFLAEDLSRHTVTVTTSHKVASVVVKGLDSDASKAPPS